MDELLRILLSWQFLVLCLGIGAITFVIRKFFEFIILSNPQLPGSKNSVLWRSLLLPILPIFVGGIATYFSKNYPYPELLGQSDFGRICFGLGAGALSTTFYRVAIELLKSKIANVVSYDENEHLAIPVVSAMPVITSDDGGAIAGVKKDDVIIQGIPVVQVQGNSNNSTLVTQEVISTTTASSITSTASPTQVIQVEIKDNEEEK